VVGPISKDYAHVAEVSYPGYAGASEGIAERFHMDGRFRKILNPTVRFVEGEVILVADHCDDQGSGHERSR
jgi:hypothetical protein